MNLNARHMVPTLCHAREAAWALEGKGVRRVIEIAADWCQPIPPKENLSSPSVLKMLHLEIMLFMAWFVGGGKRRARQKNPTHPGMLD